MSRLRVPSSLSLPEEEFRRRHRGLVCLLLVHAAALVVFGVLMGWSVAASLLAVVPAAVCVAPASWPRLSRSARAIWCVIGLLNCAAALVWLWHGTTEAHFDYFVLVGAVALYEAWLPYAIAIAYVVLQHGLMSAWKPGRVFGSMVAMQHPWLYAGIHGGFIAALAAANVVFWGAAERTRAREREAVEKALMSAQRLERAFAGSPTGAGVLTEDGTLVAVNAAMVRSLRTTEAALLGRSWIDLLEPSVGLPAVAWPPVEPETERERQVHRGDGTLGWLLTTYSRLGDGPGAEWIVQTVDVTRRRTAETQLEWEAAHDPLTGLLNRHAFAREAGELLGTRRRLGVLFVDIDDFKVVNDSLGHDAGDALLLGVTDRLRSVIRREDVIGRFGGDEFVIVLDAETPDAAEATARRVTDAFVEPFALGGATRMVTVSVGVAVAHAGEGSIDSLLRDADLAMYEAKAAGKARHAWFDPMMRTQAIDRLELEADLRSAILASELDAHYQPQVDPDGRLLGLEALARWTHPERGAIPPGVFIPIAEDSGLVSEIGEAILRRACTDLVRWTAEEPGLATTSVSVNVSPRCVHDETLPAAVAAILDETGVDPSRVCLEITETAALDRTDVTRRVIAALKELGVRLAIDDFGAGHSSLGQLASLGLVDEIKIDKAVVDGLAASSTTRHLVKAVIDVMLGDGLIIVAEGVEHAEQLDILTELGCPRIQGFLFSRPLPEPELVTWAQTAVAA